MKLTTADLPTSVALMPLEWEIAKSRKIFEGSPCFDLQERVLRKKYQQASEEASWYAQYFAKPLIAIIDLICQAALMEYDCTIILEELDEKTNSSELEEMEKHLSILVEKARLEYLKREIPESLGLDITSS